MNGLPSKGRDSIATVHDRTDSGETVSPCHAAIAQSLESRLVRDILKRFLAIFSLGEEQAIRQLLEQAGFPQPTISTHVLR